MALLFSAAPAFRTAMFNAATTLYAGESSPVLITYGMPAFDVFNDVVSMGAVTSQQAQATMGGNHSREESLTLEVIIYSFLGGGQEAELATQTRAYYLLGLLENQVRVVDWTLGSTSLRQVQLDNFSAADATDQSILAHGRMSVISATFSALARITS